MFAESEETHGKKIWRGRITATTKKIKYDLHKMKAEISKEMKAENKLLKEEMHWFCHEIRNAVHKSDETMTSIKKEIVELRIQNDLLR